METTNKRERIVLKEPTIKKGNMKPPTSYRAAPTAGPGIDKKRCISTSINPKLLSRRNSSV